MSSGDLMLTLNMSAFFAVVGFVVWVVVSGWQRRQQLKNMTEFNTRLIERIGSVKDFGDFLQTEGGAKFMDSMTVERGSVGPKDRILRATQTGIVLAMLGLGLLLLSRFTLFGSSDQGVPLDIQDLFTIFGVVSLALGAGFLVSAGVSLQLGKALDILDGTRKPSK